MLATVWSHQMSSVLIIACIMLAIPSSMIASSLTFNEQKAIERNFVKAALGNELDELRRTLEKHGSWINVNALFDNTTETGLFTSIHFQLKRAAALHGAVFNRNRAAVRLLLRYNASQYTQDAKGQMPYQLAISENSLDMMKLLVTEGKLNLSVTSTVGWTPLQEAAAFHRIDIVRLLINQGADVKIVETWASKAGRVFFVPSAGPWSLICE